MCKVICKISDSDASETCVCHLNDVAGHCQRCCCQARSCRKCCATSRCCWTGTVAWLTCHQQTTICMLGPQSMSIVFMSGHMPQSYGLALRASSLGTVYRLILRSRAARGFCPCQHALLIAVVIIAACGAGQHIKVELLLCRRVSRL